MVCPDNEKGEHSPRRNGEERRIVRCGSLAGGGGGG